MERECMGKINSYCQRNKCKLDYVDVGWQGPPHDREFTVMVKIDNKEYGTGTGKTKKEAKAAAAKKTWEMMEQKQDNSLNALPPEAVTPPVAVEGLPDFDYISLLNKYSQKTAQLVDYNNINRTGDAHAPIFSCSCTISGRIYGIGTGNSVAAAKRAAAKQAYEKLHKEGSLRVGAIFSLKTEVKFFNLLNRFPHFTIIFRNSDISFRDSASNLVEKAKDMSLSEKPSHAQRNVQSSAVKSKRVLAANFDNAKNKEQKKAIPCSYENLNRSTSEANENKYTADKRFCQEYKNIEPIGEGGFGNVFKATSKIDEKTYAVKRVEFMKNGMREVKLLANLEHENIVRYYCSWEGFDCMTYPDSRKNSDIPVRCLFIQMELCGQGPLENWIENNRLRQNYHEMAEDKFLQILKGVDYIHSRDLIHRDLKPQNIFLSYEGKIKIGDFGLVTSVTYETLTENRGTQSYMAPEQFGGRYGKEVDIYALGLIWFEMLSALVSRHAKSKVWPDVREGELPPDFIVQFTVQAPIIKRMLSKEPTKRGSASQILGFLKSVDKDNSRKAHTH
ncbi:E2AK2 kinase, partial [Penelope pileata]|nr:E2AK2 kinase [Penelope pileata]